MMQPSEIIDFWFVAHGPDDWFSGAASFDRQIAEQFGPTHAALARGEGFSWRGTAEGRLAEILVLDQFSRQLYRGQPQAFAQDGMALVLAQEMVTAGSDKGLAAARRHFVYMPYMHAESVVVHAAAGPLFAALGDETLNKIEAQHADTVARFGRFPKRNLALGRRSSPEELVYLAEIGDRGF